MKTFFLSMILLLTVYVAAGICSGTEQDGSGIELPGMPFFKMDYDAGSMPINALKVILDYHNIRISYPVLMAVSGKAFTFVYDNHVETAFQRGLCPVDYFRNITDFLGISGEWIVNRKLKSLLSVIYENISDKCPMIVPNIVSDGYHGYYIISGFDQKTGNLAIRGASVSRNTLPVQIGVKTLKDWAGPVTNELKWAKNPVFCIHVSPERKSARSKNWLLETFRRANTILGMDEVSYGPGSYYPDKKTGKFLMNRKAPHGKKAYQVLINDIEKTGPGFDFEIIRRIDSQISQLVYNRKSADGFFREIQFLMPADSHAYCDILSKRFMQIADFAVQFRKIFWNHLTVTDPEKIIQEIKKGEALVYSIDTDDSARDKITLATGGILMDSETGMFLYINSPLLRQDALATLNKILSLESEILQTLKLLIDQTENTEQKNNGITDATRQ